MITGHLGIAAATRSGWQRASLPWLAVGSVAPDLLDIAYAAVGVCNPDGSYSHALPIAALLALLFGGAALAVTKSRVTAVATAFMVLLHLPPDLVTGHKVYWPHGPMLGLRLYRRPLADFAVEALIVVTGWWLLRRSKAGPPWATSRAVLVALLLVQGGIDAFGSNAKPTACSEAQELSGALEVPADSPAVSRTLQPARALSRRSSSSRWPRNSPMAASAAM